MRPRVRKKKSRERKTKSCYKTQKKRNYIRALKVPKFLQPLLLPEVCLDQKPSGIGLLTIRLPT